MPVQRTPVLVVGGGVNGLSTALFLAHHGIRSVLVERHPDLLIHPRARGFTPRTVELFRQVGLERAVQEVAYAPGDRFAWVPVLAETLADETYTSLEEPGEGQDPGRASPCTLAPIDQDKLEIVIRARAEELGAEMRFSTELLSFDQDEHGVAAAIRDPRTGAETTIEADYLVAADGAASPVRRQLGIGVEGPDPLYDTITAKGLSLPPVSLAQQARCAIRRPPPSPCLRSRIPRPRAHRSRRRRARTPSEP